MLRGQGHGGPLVLSVVTLVVLAVAGWIGGRRADRFGVRPASESVEAAGCR